MKWIAAGFTLFIITIIVLADTGRLAGQLAWLHSLPMGDKIGHFTLVGLLAFFIAASLIHEMPQKKAAHIALVVALALALIFGLEEASQGPIRGRDANLWDLAANYAGIAMFSWLASKIKPRQASVGAGGTGPKKN